MSDSTEAMSAITTALAAASNGADGTSAVGKRLAAACHPDKAPPELNLVAAELFRLVQDMR